jgi:subtilisin family serine protease
MGSLAVIFSLGILFAGNAFAGPVKVMLRFREVTPPTRQFFAPADRELDLQRRAALSQTPLRRAIAMLPAASVGLESFWLVNAAVVSAAPELVAKLATAENVISVKPLRTVGLIAAARGATPAPPPPGYGLARMGMPAWRAVHPESNGAGVKVGILDTGIDPSHPDLAGRTVTFRDFISGSRAPYDNNFHGTHVAGIIGGGNASGVAIGVAPKVEFVVGKAFDDQGLTQEDTILRAMQWIADPDGNPATPDAPRIVSNSWSGGLPVGDPKDDVQCQAVDSWMKLGIIPVFAAGNRGPALSTVGVPGACPSALSVGATDETDALAPFSSRGTANWSTGPILKPDVVAPGVKIYSSMPGGKYDYCSGTSMAAPAAAGIAALAVQMRPNASAQEILELLRGSALDLGAPGPDPLFGSGLVHAGPW